MIFLSAQPDQYYFLWQLRLQLFNFSSLGIQPDGIHVLIGFDPGKGLSPDYAAFLMEQPAKARFFTYADTRISKNYPPSIRPHIIAKHLQANPELQNDSIFYHDSDILFRELPDFLSLLDNDVWYSSNTQAYLNSTYIIDHSSDLIFKEMCMITGIDPQTVRAGDTHAGGAQYLIKNVSAGFWSSVESGSEEVFALLDRYNKTGSICNPKNESPQIQAWCADMWVLWWKALLDHRDFRIHPALDFCWAHNHIKEWLNTNILHYTGIMEKSDTGYFDKEDYIHYAPFSDDFSAIMPHCCSYPLVQIIKAYNREQSQYRYDLSDVTFLITVRIDSESRLKNIYAIIRYILKFFSTNIFLLEADRSARIDRSLLPEGVEYFFCLDTGNRLHRTRYNNQLIARARSAYIALYDADVVFTIEQILDSVNYLRASCYSVVSPYDGNFLALDAFQKAIFLKSTDPEFLKANKGKSVSIARRSYGGALFLNREHYCLAGKDNEFIFSWGPEDIERVKRMEILGYRTKRVHGSLYHLPHERHTNSAYSNDEERCELMEEYLKIASMTKEELLVHVHSRDWADSQIVIPLNSLNN